jgi:hypothetical protein
MRPAAGHLRGAGGSLNPENHFTINAGISDRNGVDALTAAGSERLPVLKAFMLSEGRRYQELVPVRRLRVRQVRGRGRCVRPLEDAVVSG